MPANKRLKHMAENINLGRCSAAAGIGFVMAIIAYDPIAAVRFDALFFNNLSLGDIAGSHALIVKGIVANLFGLCCGYSCYYCEQEWQLPFYINLPLSILGGLVALACAVFLLAITAAILAFIFAIFALFFGPGDR
tara:strand:+ start:6842 stop:7249 length:408 start_codon:yes stop_codon:yes gene_type:complete